MLQTIISIITLISKISNSESLSWHLYRHLRSYLQIHVETNQGQDVDESNSSVICLVVHRYGLSVKA